MTLTFAALHINTNLYLCEFADAPTRGRELVFAENRFASQQCCWTPPRGGEN